MKGNGLHKSPGPCPRHFILLQSLFCLLSTFSPNSPLPHNHLTGTTGDALSTVPQHQLSGGQMSSPQGFRDEARVAKPWPRWPIPRLRPGPAPLQPTGARSRRPQPGLPHAGSLGPAQEARTAPHAPRGMLTRAGGRRGQPQGRGRDRGRRLTHAYTRPSASSTPSPPYRGTCVQQLRHIRAGPARLLRRPQLLPGRRLRSEVHPGRARVTWSADVCSQRPR